MPQEARIGRRRLAITTEQRCELRRHAKACPHLRQPQLASWFEDQYGHRISQATVSESLSSRFQHLDGDTAATAFIRAQRKKRNCEWPQLEEALFEWH